MRVAWQLTTHRTAELLAGYRGRFCKSGRGEEGDGVSESVAWGGCPETGILTGFRALLEVLNIARGDDKLVLMHLQCCGQRRNIEPIASQNP